MANKRVAYTREQLIQWLRTNVPEVDWDLIASDLPPVIWRHRWPQLSEKFGLPYSKGHLQNLDSRGIGPSSMVVEQK